PSLTQPVPKAPPQPPAPAPTKPTPPPAPAVKADPEATRLLDEAVKNFEQNPVQWLKTEIWQQVDVQGLMFQCTGPYLYGPNYKVHLDLNVSAGDLVNRLEIVCDGNTRWEVRHLSAAKPEVQRTD